MVAEDLPEHKGYTWTLVSRLGQMLAMAEKQFGDRDRSYTVLGIEFVEDVPKIWFPGSCKHIIIQLALPNANNMLLGCWQLAHECVHLLSPDPSTGSTVLEEGLCVVFQEQYVATKFGITIATHTPAYREAATLVSELLAMDSGAIIALRREQPAISSISSQLIQKHYPDIRSEVADRLAMPFQNSNKSA